ncbi:MAG: hypothetical protein KDC28_16140 [Saprospiraceae bacterium]|nr:hypothetical protein [Saprospiraceae bacterium]
MAQGSVNDIASFNRLLTGLTLAFLLTVVQSACNNKLLTSDPSVFPGLQIPPRNPAAEGGAAFMARIADLDLSDREAAISAALAAGNMPFFLRQLVTLTVEVPDAHGSIHHLEYQVMPDYLAVGSDTDYCRIPMNPHTAQRLATLFHASLITAQISDQIYANATIRLAPFFYAPVGRENESVAKFIAHNTHIQMQKDSVGGQDGPLIAGIKKDVILSNRMAGHPDKVVIYGWHKPDGLPIQPVYSGHADWYVDYSHGVRLMNNYVLVDGKPALLTDLLQDPVQFKLVSDEISSMKQAWYTRQ